METSHSVLEEWEAEGMELLAPVRGATPAPRDELADRTLDHVYTAIGARDLVEFGTSVLVLEFLGPVLDALAFTLGLEE